MKSVITLLVSAVITLAPLTACALEVRPPAATPETATAPVEDPAKPLGALVGKLSALDTLAPSDLADFANVTITYSEALQNAKQPVSEKPIRDALAAVTTGSAQDPKSKIANWNDLQARLEKFLEKSDQQKQDQQQQQDKNKQQQDKQDKQNQQQNQQGQSGDKNDQQKDQKNQQDQQQQGQDGQKQQASDKQQGQDQQNQQQQNGQQGQPQDDKNQSGKQDGGQQQQQDQNQKKESAFGNMQKQEGDKKDASEKNSAQEAQQQQAQPAQTGETQQVGGNNTKQVQVDPRMLVPLQKLDEVRGKDSPAVIFQRMQAAQSADQPQTGDPLKPKGKDW